MVINIVCACFKLDKEKKQVIQLYPFTSLWSFAIVPFLIQL